MSLIVDVRATVIFFGLMDGTLHGPLHTFVFGSLLGIALAGTTYYLQPYSEQLVDLFELEQLTEWKNYLAAGLLGVWIHISLDSILYTDIQPFMPLNMNPFYGITPMGSVYLSCAVAGILGLFYYGYIYFSGSLK